MALIDRRGELERRVVGLGLSCTLEGVSLAGAPLLRRTVAGLAPRPMAELAVLMKSAYGRDIDPAPPYRGLDVIARALNQGDIGRAMVAAIQLRLPDLDEEGATHVVLTDGALNKYDSNEPRDGRGRWTNGGGSLPNNSAKPAGRKPRVTPIRPKKPVGRHPDLRTAGAKPILVSGPGASGPLPPIESFAIILGISHACVNHAHEPRYYEKTQACANVSEQCGWLAGVNVNDPLRRDACLWPDGAAVVMKMGVMVPVRFGHRF